MRVLFLDIDGVVLSGEELWRTHDARYLPPHKLAMVKNVCDQAGAVIVVSSTWRYSDTTADQLRAHGLTLHLDWRTPRSKLEGALFIATTRGSEIYRWLAKHREVERYAIIDDDSDMLPEQMANFVQTQFEIGITKSHVDRLISILSC